MNHRTLFVAAAALLVGAAAAGRFQVAPEEDAVLVLTTDNFDEVVAQHEAGIMVEFYAPWCGHCKKLAPEYKKAAAVLMTQDPPVRLAMVDATEERAIAEKFDVRGFPTLKFIRGGEATEYDGGRTERDIVAYMKKKTGPPAAELADTAALNKAKESAEVVVAGFFPSMESPEAALFLDVAAGIDSFEFFFSTTAGVIEGAEANSVVVFKTFDEGRNDLALTATSDKAAVKHFLNAMTMPKVMEFNKELSGTIFRGPLKVHLLTFVDTAADYATAIRAAVDQAADAHRGDMLHIIVPSSEDRVMDYFGFKTKDLPKTVLADMRSDGAMKKYNFAGVEHTPEALVAFENDFFDGALKPTLKSEDDKPSHMKGPVKVITGKSFEGEVLTSGKDVLLEFYAPWCGHCKSLAPKYEELGEKFASVESKVIIAKMDATANEIDHPDVAVQGFPTLYFFPNGGKPVQYEGPPEVADLTKYLQTHATHEFTLEDGLKGGPSFRDEL